MTNRIFSIIGTLGTIFVALSIAIWVATRTRLNLSAEWDQYRLYLAWAGLVCVLMYILSQWREVAQAFSRRQARYGTLAGASVLIVLGILVAVNYIGREQNRRWDLTASRQFSLSDQSRNVLAKLDAPLHIMVFAQEPEFQIYQDRIREYEDNSKQITSEYIDPDKRRAVAQENEVQQYGTIVVKYMGRTERTTMNSEQDITNTIIKAVSGMQRKVYLTQGHGEKDSGSTEREGYGTIAEALGRENYLVEKVVLAQTGAVPEDASVVVIAGPRTDFFPQEIDALNKYLGNAGKLLLLLDPPEKAGADLPNLVALAREWAIEAQNTVVVDVSGMGQLIGTDASVPVAATYPAHPITDRFNILTAYPLARAVVPVAGGVGGRTAQTFVESSDRSWAESDLQELLSSGKVAMDPNGGDKPGPVSLAAAVSAPVASAEALTPADAAEGAKPESRVVVFGDSDFASNAVLGIPGNRDSFMNTVGWLSQQENLISIRPREPDDRRLTLTAAEQGNVMWLSLLVIPGMVFGTGIYSWWRRR